MNNSSHNLIVYHCLTPDPAQVVDVYAGNALAVAAGTDGQKFRKVEIFKPKQNL